MKCMCVALFVEFALILMIVQKNGAPVWLARVAFCDRNVLQWLVAKGIKPPAVDSYVWHCGELGMIRVTTMVLVRLMAKY